MKKLAALPHWQTLLLLAGVCVAVSAVGNNLVALNVLTLIAISSIIALSVGISYGQAGILSVAQGTFASIGAYTTGILGARYGWSPFAALPLAVLLPAVFAYPLAYLVMRLSPLALAIATLLFGKIVDIALRSGEEFTGGYIGLSGVPPLDPFAQPVWFNGLAWALVLAVVWTTENLMRSSFGRAVNTIRHDPVRATADGVDVRAMQSAVFALGAAVAGLGGWLYAHYLSFISPESLGLQVSISALLMAVVGGSSYLLGPIVGAVVLTLIVNHFPGAAEMQGMFYGGALLLILLVAPGGIVGLLAQRRRRARVSGRGAAAQGVRA